MAPRRRSSSVRAKLGETHRAPLSSWARPVVLAVAVAYWTVLQERGEAMEAHRAATDAFLAAGGDPEAAARDHPDWLYQSARERIAREERWWRDRGV